MASGQVLTADKPDIGMVNAFLETSLGILAADMNGIAIFRNGRFQMLNFSDARSAHGVTGIVQSRNGDVWLNGLRGVVRVPSQELRAWLDIPGHLMQTEVLSEGEFTGPAPLFQQTPSATRDADGKLWFCTLNGIASIDPEHLHPHSHLPQLAIRSISAGKIPIETGMKLPPKSETLLVRYFGVNLTAPTAVVYRYKLDGLDTSWQDAGHRTEATYTNLHAGKCTFRVIASNGGNQRTEPVSSVSFDVLPHFYQTWWFATLWALGALLILWSVLHLRGRYVASMIKARARRTGR